MALSATGRGLAGKPQQPPKCAPPSRTRRAAGSRCGRRTCIQGAQWVSTRLIGSPLGRPRGLPRAAGRARSGGTDRKSNETKLKVDFSRGQSNCRLSSKAASATVPSNLPGPRVGHSGLRLTCLGGEAPLAARQRGMQQHQIGLGSVQERPRVHVVVVVGGLVDANEHAPVTQPPPNRSAPLSPSPRGVTSAANRSQRLATHRPRSGRSRNGIGGSVGREAGALKRAREDTKGKKTSATASAECDVIEPYFRARSDGGRRQGLRDRPRPAS